MSEKKVEKKETKTKTKKRLSKSALVLIIGLIIIAIPIVIFFSILGIASLQTGTPRDGSRFDNDLDPKITSENVNQIQNSLNSIGGIESVEVVLSEGQLKIFIDTNDNLTEEQIDSIITDAYNKVNTTLPINTYFASTSTKKMYDLQINVYTSPEASSIGDESSRQYKVLHKNSAEESYGIDDLAHPKNPTLAAELEGLLPSEEEETEETSEE